MRNILHIVADFLLGAGSQNHHLDHAITFVSILESAFHGCGFNIREWQSACI